MNTAAILFWVICFVVLTSIFIFMWRGSVLIDKRWFVALRYGVYSAIGILCFLFLPAKNVLVALVLIAGLFILSAAASLAISLLISFVKKFLDKRSENKD